MSRDQSGDSLIESSIKEYIIREIAVRPDLPQISNDTKLIETGVLDSLSVLKLVVFIEEKFGFKVPPNEVVPDNFETIATMGNYVRSKKT